ncbi:MAG: trypsin-like peptidase domain-containing protein [Gammaproteobacteria bacterium]|nr:trypsin-like peptidase domain-containing protein [Gammaproteobacteria bacterium]
MRLTEDAKKCVVFLGDGAVDGSTFEARATGFFVDHMDDKWQTPYLVTSKHCVSKRLSDPFHIRFNDRQKGAFLVHIDQPDWVFHEDPDVDLAVLELAPDPRADSLVFRHEAILTAPHERAAWGRIGPGDLTYTVGLFGFLAGTSRNIPLVHTGHIAAFPEDERIEVSDWDQPDNTGKYRNIEAYVVQCTALPGASGSPVFVRPSVDAAHKLHDHSPAFIANAEKTRMFREIGAYGPLYLVGVWHGAWEINKARIEKGVTLRDPAGYGIVVPSHKLLEILDIPKLKVRRDRARDEDRKANAPRT